MKDKEIKNSIVYVAFQVIPRSQDKNNFELVDKAIEVVKASGVIILKTR